MKVINFILFIAALFTGHFCDAQIITTIAGNGSPGSSGDDGPATNAEFIPSGIATDKWGNIYISDCINNVIRKIDNTGIITRFAGTGMHGTTGDGGPATNAQLYLNPGLVGIAVDSTGNVCFADGTRVRVVNTSGIISTVAGGTTWGYSGDGSPATSAQLAAPTGICFDKTGNLYIADDGNNNIRFVTTASIISTIAGTTIGFSGDSGPATDAKLNDPYDIAIDDSLNLYISDIGNYRFRKVNNLGIISTFAGNGATWGCTICANSPATSMDLHGPSGITTDNSGNVYIADVFYQLLYEINTSGIANPIAGNYNVSGFSGDGGPASAALLNVPSSLCMDNEGNLLLIDHNNYRIRKIWFTPANVPKPKASSSLFSIYPNPTTGSINITGIGIVNIKVYNTIGKLIKEANNTDNISISEYPPGMYFIRLFNTEGLPVYQSKIIKE